jgi:hypothetical protein
VQDWLQEMNASNERGNGQNECDPRHVEVYVQAKKAARISWRLEPLGEC